MRSKCLKKLLNMSVALFVTAINLAVADIEPESDISADQPTPPYKGEGMDEETASNQNLTDKEESPEIKLPPLRNQIIEDQKDIDFPVDI